jgi:type IV secretory pathway VirB10-like protein
MRLASVAAIGSVFIVSVWGLPSAEAQHGKKKELSPHHSAPKPPPSHVEHKPPPKPHAEHKPPQKPQTSERAHTKKPDPANGHNAHGKHHKDATKSNREEHHKDAEEKALDEHRKEAEKVAREKRRKEEERRERERSPHERQIIASLHSVARNLHRADHDYDGERHRAYEHVRNALRELHAPDPGDHGKFGGMTQKHSDEILRGALSELRTLKSRLSSTREHQAARHSLELAEIELHKALKIR